MIEKNPDHSIILRIQPEQNSLIAMLSTIQKSVNAIHENESFQSVINILQAVNYNVTLVENRLNAFIPIQRLNALAENIARLLSYLLDLQKVVQATEFFRAIEGAVTKLNQFNHTWNEHGDAALRSLNNFTQSNPSSDELQNFKDKFDKSLDELSTNFTEENSQLSVNPSDKNTVITLGIEEVVNVQEEGISVLALLLGWVFLTQFSWEQFETELLPTIKSYVCIIVGKIILSSLNIIKN